MWRRRVNDNDRVCKVVVLFNKVLLDFFWGTSIYDKKTLGSLRLLNYEAHTLDFQPYLPEVNGVFLIFMVSSHTFSAGGPGCLQGDPQVVQFLMDKLDDYATTFCRTETLFDLCKRMLADPVLVEFIHG